ncbi:MlaD family protein, partial [Kibdelosporangium lantanae]
MSTRIRYQLLGLVFLLIVALFVYLTVASYRKAFTPVAMVTLQTDHVGNQLQAGADVKVRGMIVGEVRDIRAMGDHAEMDLAMQPDKLDAIPANVSARLLPKTLFGERYV